MKHTAGPWEIDPRCATRVRDTADTTIASAGLASRDRDDAEANARLIAASPDLLKALKVAAKLLQTVTIKQVFELGTEAINAVGLNPCCMNEGRATGDEPISLDFIYRAISKAEAE